MENRKVYETLENIGMTQEQIDKATNINKNLERVLDTDVKQMIEFFKTYGLTNEEIIEIENKNPYFLTESFVRIRFLEEDYQKLGITDFADLLKKHPSAMSINPQVLHDYIENNIKNQKTIEKIKEEIYEKFETLFPYM